MRSYGLVVSLVVHALILSIPISMAVHRHLREVEFSVIHEEPIPPPVPKKKPPPLEAKVINAPRPVPLPPPAMTKPVERIEIKPVEDRTVPLETAEVKELRQEDAPAPLPAPQAPRVEQVREASPPHPVKGPIQKEGREEPRPEKVPLQEASSPPEETLFETGFGQGDGPRFRHRQMPEYPYMARRMGKEGRVVLRLTIDEKGELLQVEVMDGAGFGLTEAAIRAVKSSTFFPAMREGKPVRSRAILPIQFVLRRDG